MNKNTFVKFSLTLVSAAVLAACSSSGGGNDNSAAEAKKKQEIEATKLAEQKKAEEAAKLAEQQKAKEAAAAEAKIKATQQVGHKFVKKVESNLNVGTGTAITDHASTSVTAMRLSLEPSLDTIVVAIPLDKDGKADPKGKQAYLEDFDFRGNVDNTTGLHTLEHIYVGKTTNNTESRGANTLTKTDTMGTDKGIAVVYEQGRLNYTDYEGKDVADPKVKRTQKYLSTVDNGKGSVSEVYGHRTFAEGNSQVDEAIKDAPLLANAPFTRLVNDKAQSYTDGKLAHVQYGRVTSNLHGVSESALKDGKKLGDYGTKVAGFGHYQDKDTDANVTAGIENHYFYRGTDNTKYSETLAADLNKHYFGKDAKSGNLQYQGHAVTYGIDHKFNSTDGIPNAIGYKQELVSGTHVFANVDLGTKAVTGNLYDVWRHGNRSSSGYEIKKVELANFEGKLENNGAISGSSVRTADSDKGTFNATLFGDNAQELGGAIASSESLQDKQWGAVFGAKVQNKYQAPNIAPKPTPIPAWGESTDQKDTNSPIK